MKVAVCWWPPGTSPGGRTQAIRGNTRGFSRAGHEVDLWYKPQIEAMPHDEYDLILSPFIDRYWPETTAHVHLQLGGFGPPNLDDESVRQTVLAADSVSVLDTRLAYHYAERVGLDPDGARVIPNPPNFDLFAEQGWDETTGLALMPKVGGPYKNAERAAQLAAQTNDVTYWCHTSEAVDLGGNVRTRPPVPLSAMPRQYRRAEAVVNISEQEGLPNVAYEAFLTGRPYVSTRRATGEIQLLPAAAVSTEDFGASASWWRDLANDYSPGDHLVPVDDEHFPEAVKDVMNDPEMRRDVGERGRHWVESVFGGSERPKWWWKEKAECIVSCALS